MAAHSRSKNGVASQAPMFAAISLGERRLPT